jgi:hypothetical protein
VRPHRSAVILLIFDMYCAVKRARYDLTFVSHVVSTEGAQSSHKLSYLVHHLQGVPTLAHFWYEAMTSAPDLVCTLKHTRLKIRTDGTAVIQCCFALTGTKIIYIADPNDPETQRKLAFYRAAAAQNRAHISQMAAAIAAVAPAKAASALHTQEKKQNGAEDDDSLNVSDGSLLDRYVEQPTASNHTNDHTRTKIVSAATGTCGTKPTARKRPRKGGNRALDWLAVGHEAYRSGPVVSATQRDSDFASGAVNSASSQGCSGTVRNHEADAVGNTLENILHSGGLSSSPAPRQVVLAGGMDCVCSMEMCLNADNRVVSMVLNYIT